MWSKIQHYGPGKWFHSPGPYNEERRKYECVFFYVNGMYREKPVFEIEYEMSNAAIRYGDCSELYLNMFSESSVNYLNSFKGEILIANKDMPSNKNYTANTYGTNTGNFEFKESSSKNPGYHTFYFELDKNDLKFRPYNEYIEFSLISFGDDKFKFTDYAKLGSNFYSSMLSELKEEHEYYTNLPEHYGKVKLIIFGICVAWSFLVIRKLLTLDNKIEKKYQFFKPSMQIKYFRDIPSDLDPAAAAELVFSKKPQKKSKQEQNVYSAILLSLVRKKYIEVQKINDFSNWKPENVKIIIKNEPQVVVYPTYNLNENNIIEPSFGKEDLKGMETLSPSEDAYFKLIKRHSLNNEITMSKLQSKLTLDYDYTNSFVDKVSSSFTDIGISKDYIQKFDYRAPQRELKTKKVIYIIIGIIFLVFANLISYQTYLDLAFGGYTLLGITYLFGAYISHYLSKKYILFTQYGEDEYSKWRGLYDFLNSETLMHEKTVIELPLWEKYLVYATAFGISDKVIKALKINCPDYESSQLLSTNSYYRSTNFSRTSHSFRRSVRTASFTSSSYGSSGHGGYGGGGRGGGGGRRRSLNPI